MPKQLGDESGWKSPGFEAESTGGHTGGHNKKPHNMDESHTYETFFFSKTIVQENSLGGTEGRILNFAINRNATWS